MLRTHEASPLSLRGEPPKGLKGSLQFLSLAPLLLRKRGLKLSQSKQPPIFYYGSLASAVRERERGKARVNYG